MGAGFGGFEGVSDLNGAQPIWVAWGLSLRGRPYEPRQDAVRPVDGLRALEDLSPDCWSLRRRSPCAHAELCGAVAGKWRFAIYPHREVLRHLALTQAAGHQH